MFQNKQGHQGHQDHRDHRSRGPRKPVVYREPFCHFCVTKAKDIDYKNTQVLERFLSNYSKILPRRRMHLCMKHQRMLSQAVKRARFMALVPYTSR